MTNDLDWRARKVEMARGGTERRTFKGGGMTFRNASPSERRLTGWAAVTGVEYEMGSDWNEVVAPSAFRRCLGESPDVPLLLGHGEAGSGLPLARTTAGTLTLREDGRGLFFDAVLDPDDPDVRLLEAKLRSGALDGQCSMAFKVNRDRWSKDGRLRTLEDINLHRGDISVVVHAASPTTSATLRHALRSLPDFTTGAAQRLEVLRRQQGPRRSPPGVSPPPSMDHYRARIAQLRRR